MYAVNHVVRSIRTGWHWIPHILVLEKVCKSKWERLDKFYWWLYLIYGNCNTDNQVSHTISASTLKLVGHDRFFFRNISVLTGRIRVVFRITFAKDQKLLCAYSKFNIGGSKHAMWKHWLNNVCCSRPFFSLNINRVETDSTEVIEIILYFQKKNDLMVIF